MISDFRIHCWAWIVVWRIIRKVKSYCKIWSWPQCISIDLESYIGNHIVSVSDIVNFGISGKKKKKIYNKISLTTFIQNQQPIPPGTDISLPTLTRWPDSLSLCLVASFGPYRYQSVHRGTACSQACWRHTPAHSVFGFH